jgi:hypothetical protein
MPEDSPNIEEEELEELEEEVIGILKEGSARATDQAENEIKEAINNVVESGSE